MTTTVDDTKPASAETNGAAAETSTAPPETKAVTDDTKPASKAAKVKKPASFKRVLPCLLTDKEKLDIGDAIVEADDEISALEDQKKSASDGFKAKIELAEGERRELVQKLRTGMEEREVACVEKFDFERNTVEEIRTDTNARLSSRAMTPDERQGELNLPDPPARKADPAPPAASDTDIEVTPDLLAAADKAAAEEGGAVKPVRRQRKATTEQA